MRRILAVQAALLILLVSGCAKRPATSQSSAPAPGGSTGSTASRIQGGTTAPGAASRAASRTDGAATARPAPKEFTAIAALRDINFDFDKYEIRPADVKTLDANAAWLRSNARHLVLIEGHCDERGTDEYNLALGERRAKATMNYLVAHGVRANRITIISYGEERPLCAEHSDTCWNRNRRAQFLVKPE